MTTEPRARNMTAAIRIAARNVHLVKTTPDGYEIRTYCPKRHAFIAGPPQPFDKARVDATQARHAEALSAMGWAAEDAWHEAHSFSRGSLRDRLRASIKRDRP